MKKDRWNGQSMLMTPVLIGIAVSLVLCVILISVVTTMILNESLSQEHLKYISPCLHLIVLFAGCFCAGTTSGKNILVCAAIVFAVNYFVCVGTTILAFDGIFEGVLFNLAAGLVGTVAALIVSTKKGQKTKINFRKPKIC